MKKLQIYVVEMGARERGDILEITPGFVKPTLTPIVGPKFGKQATHRRYF